MFIEPDESVPQVRIGIVISQYNKTIIERLQDACLNKLESCGVESDKIHIIKVPGAYEIPVIARSMASSKNYDAIISLGAIIRGETPHFDLIADCCSRGIMEISIDSGIPVIFGVLTVDNIQQAMDRSGDEESNKGAEAARAALDMISVLRKFHEIVK
jgi:6,7-dimethyl-8-ribityllumazine synthase